MDIYSTTIAVSILVDVVIGNYAGRGVKRLDDYYDAGRRAPTLIIVGTLVASVLSSTMFLGEAKFAYETQAGPYVLFLQAANIGYVLGAIVFALGGYLLSVTQGAGNHAAHQVATAEMIRHFFDTPD